MKKILFIAPKYTVDKTNPYLTNDLVNQFCQQEYEVTVVAYGERNFTHSNSNKTEYVIQINSTLKIVKYFFIWPKLGSILLHLIKTKTKYDHVFMIGPLTVMWPAAFLVKFIKARKKTAMIFDIFPIHQIKIGSLPKCLNSILKFLERRLLNNFTEITAMGENNKKYIESYYSTEKMGKKVKIVTLWGRGKALKKINREDDDIRVIFGGQIIKGRELNTLINFFEELRSRGLPLLMDVYSQGPGFEELKLNFSARKWINFENQIPRDEYFERLSHYDVGTVVTDKHSDLPTFPSKIIDYIEANLGVYCLVEKESDLHSLTKYSEVYINSFSFTEDEIIRSLNFLSNIKKVRSVTSLFELKELFSLHTAALRLME